MQVSGNFHNTEFGAKICGTEVMPYRLHVNRHVRSVCKARRHDLWRRDVLSRRRRSWRRPSGSKNAICFFKTLNVKFVYKKGQNAKGAGSVLPLAPPTVPQLQLRVRVCGSRVSRTGEQRGGGARAREGRRELSGRRRREHGPQQVPPATCGGGSRGTHNLSRIWVRFSLLGRLGYLESGILNIF